MEEWRDIENYDGIYQVSNIGNVMNIKTNHMITPIITEKGYARIRLNYGKMRYVLLHRLVANAFIENIDNKPQINHKDGNKLNNTVDNLEWCTGVENINHAFDNNLMAKKKKPVLGWNKKNGCLIYFESINDVVRHFNTTQSCVYGVLSGRNRSVKGHYLMLT